MFISAPYEGNYYIAEPSRKGSAKLLWSMMPVESVAAAMRIVSRDVPYAIRQRKV